MRNAWIATALFVTTATAAAPTPDVVQATNGTKDVAKSSYGKQFLAITSKADLAPNAPGNADGSQELFLVNHKTLALTQITAVDDPAAIVNGVAWQPDGRLLLRSNRYLAPGPTGTPAVTQFYLFKPGKGAKPGTFEWVRPAGDADVEFTYRGYLQNGRALVFESSGDAVAGGNADGSQELYLFDVKKKTLRQITKGSGDSTYVGTALLGKKLVVQSTSDLSGKGTNASGKQAVFLLDPRTFAAEQITDGATDAFVDSISPTEKWLMVGVVDPGGVTYHTAFYDVRARRTIATIVGANAQFDNFGAPLVVIQTGEDLVPVSLTTPGNADGTQELFTLDLKTAKFVQRTNSSGDTYLETLSVRKGGPAIVHSNADLAPGAPGNTGGVDQLFLVPVGPTPKSIVQVTHGATPTFGAFGDAFGVLTVVSRADLVPGGNTDGSQEIFVAPVKTPTALRQLTSSIADSSVAAVTPDGRRLYVLSKGDLAPGTPGNADGSRELFSVKVR